MRYAPAAILPRIDVCTRCHARPVGSAVVGLRSSVRSLRSAARNFPCGPCGPWLEIFRALRVGPWLECSVVSVWSVARDFPWRPCGPRLEIFRAVRVVRGSRSSVRSVPPVAQDLPWLPWPRSRKRSLAIRRITVDTEDGFMKARAYAALCGALTAFVLVWQAPGLAQVRKPTGVSAITAADMKEWLTYIASDQLQGRQVYTEGLGLAASYIAEHLKAWGIKPAGDDGTYFQVVKVLGVNVKRGSTVTVTVNGQSKTFK